MDGWIMNGWMEGWMDGQTDGCQTNASICLFLSVGVRRRAASKTRAVAGGGGLTGGGERQGVQREQLPQGHGGFGQVDSEKTAAQREPREDATVVAASCFLLTCRRRPRC